MQNAHKTQDPKRSVQASSPMLKALTDHSDARAAKRPTGPGLLRDSGDEAVLRLLQDSGGNDEAVWRGGFELEGLPEELLSRILTFVPICGLARLALSSKTMGDHVIEAMRTDVWASMPLPPPPCPVQLGKHARFSRRRQQKRDFLRQDALHLLEATIFIHAKRPRDAVNHLVRSNAASGGYLHQCLQLDLARDGPVDAVENAVLLSQTLATANHTGQWTPSLVSDVCTFVIGDGAAPTDAITGHLADLFANVSSYLFDANGFKVDARQKIETLRIKTAVHALNDPSGVVLRKMLEHPPDKALFLLQLNGDFLDSDRMEFSDAKAEMLGLVLGRASHGGRVGFHKLFHIMIHLDRID